jgi:transposase
MLKKLLVLQAAQGWRLRLMFQDEARFGRISDPRRCWGPRPLRPQVKSALVREYLYAYAAISPGDGVLDSLILPEASTICMNVFLAEVAARHRQDFIVMVLDGAGWHRSHDLEIPENMKLLPLPPYSPELNPVEHLWEELREKSFHNKVFDSLDAVESQLMEALFTLEKDSERITSMSAWPWIINIILNAN